MNLGPPVSSSNLSDQMSNLSMLGPPKSSVLNGDSFKNNGYSNLGPPKMSENSFSSVPSKPGHPESNVSNGSFYPNPVSFEQQIGNRVDSGTTSGRSTPFHGQSSLKAPQSSNTNYQTGMTSQYQTGGSTSSGIHQTSQSNFPPVSQYGGSNNSNSSQGIPPSTRETLGQPGWVSSTMGQPGMAPSQMGQPGMAPSQMGQPGIASSMGQHSMGSSQMRQPGMAPSMPQSTMPSSMGQPGMAPSQMNQSGTAPQLMGQSAMAPPQKGQSGMPSSMGQHNMVPPQMGQSNMPPSMGQHGMAPPQIEQRSMPPSMGQTNMPSLMGGQHGMAPPSMSQSGMAPPQMGQSGMPPSMPQSSMLSSQMSQPGMAPPQMGQSSMPSSKSQSSMPSSMGQPGMASSQMSQSGMAPPQMGQPAMAPPQMGQSGMPPLMGQSGIPPSMGQSGMRPSMPQSGMRPSMPQSGMPSQSMGQPGMHPQSMPQSGMLPQSMGQPGMPPQSMGQPGMPPSSMGQPGMPPQSMVLPGMPPSSIRQPGMAPSQMRQSGMPPPMGQHGMGSQSMGQPGMPPPMGQHGMPPSSMGQPGMAPLPPMGQHGMPPSMGMHGMPPSSMGQSGMAPPSHLSGQQGMTARAPPIAQQPLSSSLSNNASRMQGYPDSNRRSLDPDQMPSPITVMENDARHRSGYFDTREKGLVPPLVTTPFIVRDFGNASPRYIRSSLYYIPATSDLMKQSGVPFGLVISPLAKTEDEESEPLLTDFGPSGPVRCVRCNAYMCSFMQFLDGGRRFQCVFCKATSDVPSEYFQHLDHNGLRLDHLQRPELCMGTYDAIATAPYCRDSKPPTVPGIIFAFDVSYPMMKEGIVELLCQNMKQILFSLSHRPRIGFMTYDNKIHFYNLNGVLSQPQMMTVGDIHDMFVPLSEGFFVTYEEAESVIDLLLTQIPSMFSETRETETLLGPVIQAGTLAFKASNTVGKLIIFHHNLPVCEAPGKLKNRDDRKLLGTEKEKIVLAPSTKFYNELGQDAVSTGVSVDLFLFNNAYVDVATLSQICRLTGGQVYKYTYFVADVDGQRCLRDLHRNLSRPTVFDAIMRVRTSTGVRPVDFFGSFFMANTKDAELASCNSDMAITCEIKHDDKLTEEDGVYIQVALLFTSIQGVRKLRIINLSLNTGTSLSEMYKYCELDTIINFLTKQNINQLMVSNPKAVKESLINNCAHILACYRKNCANPSAAGQLILPECMKLLPIYINCLLKSDALSGGSDLGCDERAYIMGLTSTMDVSSSVPLLYPTLIPLHQLSRVESENEAEDYFPSAIRCSSEKIQEDGVYLLENGLHLFMYLGLSVSTDWVMDVFGVPTVSHIDVEKVRICEEKRNTVLYKKVMGIIEQIRDKRPRYMKLILVRPKEKLDILFRHYLVEDQTGSEGNFSYVDFLCYMHKEIRALMN